MPSHTRRPAPAGRPYGPRRAPDRPAAGRLPAPLAAPRPLIQIPWPLPPIAPIEHNGGPALPQVGDKGRRSSKRTFRLDRLLVRERDPLTGKVKPGFETEAKAKAEDTKRASLLDRHIDQQIARAAKGKAGDPADYALPVLDLEAAEALRDALLGGTSTGQPPQTLASCLYMRQTRLTLFSSILEALDGVPNANLRTITVINTQWRYTADELASASAAAIKRQFRKHLERVGVLDMPGLLVAFLHGEFEPSSGTYLLHFHVLTTREKAAALKAGLRGKWGYQPTATGAAPIVRQRVQDRPRQFSYLLKSYWPEKPVVQIDGVPKRTRVRRRIKGPHHSQFLLWLHAQQMPDLMLCNRCRYRHGEFRVG